MKQLIVAPAPHAHSGDSVRRNMLLVILALIPAYAVSVVEFGWGALMMMAISVAACVCCEWLLSKYVLKQKPTIYDCSAILTGMLLALNVPSNLDWWILIIGAVVAIGVGKMTFGGLGQNPFNPALVGRVFLLISFPAQMTTWPKAQGFASAIMGQELTDANSGATPLYYLKHMVKAHDGSVINQLPDGCFCRSVRRFAGRDFRIGIVVGWFIPYLYARDNVAYSCIDIGNGGIVCCSDRLEWCIA